MTLRDQIFAGLPPLRSHAQALVLCGLVLLVLSFSVWAHYAELDEQVRASGSFIASSRSQVIQAVDAGAILELRVKQGDTVTAGQVLAVLDPQRSQASKDETGAKVAGLKANIARLTAELNGGEPNYPPEIRSDPQLMASQTQLMQQRRRAIQEDLGALEKSLDLARKERAAFERLATTGDASEAEILKSRRLVADLEGQIIAKRNKYLQDSQAELTKSQDDLSQAQQQLSQRSSILAATQLKSPVSGVVKNVKVTTIGGVMKAGEELMDIVPSDDPLIVEAKVRPADIAFLRPGLPASIRLDAYDYTIYGSIRGKVTYLSADTLTEDTRQGQITYYRVQIASDEQHPRTLKGEPFEIIPGMQASVEIRTGRRSVANYLLKPLRRVASESLTER